MKGLAMKTVAALALLVFCFIIGPPALRAEDIVTEPILTFIGHTNQVTSVAFSRDGTKVLTGSGDYTARLWEPDSGVWIPPAFTGHTHHVTSVAFSPDGTKVLTGSYDSTAMLWDAATRSCILTFIGHTSHVFCVAYSPDGTKVLTGSALDDKTAKLWDAATGACIRTFSGHNNQIHSIAFSPDGTNLLTGSADKTAKLWDAVTGACIRTFSDTGGVSQVTFSPDGTKVLTGSDDKTAKLWDAPTGLCIRTFSGHTARVASVASSPDGTKVLTGSHDNTAKLWRAAPHLLAVRSTPITGVSITGDKPGTTPYTATCIPYGQVVSLIAQPGLFVDFRAYVFIRWLIDGQPQPLRQGTIELTIETDTAAQAVYGLFGDANGDCSVNVLDLIFVRNRLNGDPATGDNWRGDVNEDGRINILDLIYVRNELNSSCP